MSNTIYIEYTFKVTPLQPGSDILIAQLGEVGFESFVETEEGVLSYINKEDWQQDIINGIQVLKNPNFRIEHRISEIEQENWNRKWESNFNPIQVGKECTVRAPFHQKPKMGFDVVIEPKMSFGTGHHETTHMMLQHILDHDFKGKGVLDMGSGTGVLAILTAMKGAAYIDAIDVDHWCTLNATENVERNRCTRIRVLEGDVTLLKDQKYDVILANINRNILLGDIPAYTSVLDRNGMLFLSGFYKEDIPLISSKCTEVGLKFEKILEKNNWVAVKYVF
ncbi:50S ribosomal protein L11 methyltransferase [Flavobacteriaceae bacterium F89]|uniref:Ribosomal protein L11 methyltransferase n=1 Tax=Cerina litoralis TaxID=2874477 RepID=A0AAE3ERC9_9FLAO|nr:50S ribosomal protein L11 methyltransferase [Cerina litoralis]MCG2459717.1 50S ribosomal protein L11 methyltransferase [Cerina litoralis]